MLLTSLKSFLSRLNPKVGKSPGISWGATIRSGLHVPICLKTDARTAQRWKQKGTLETMWRKILEKRNNEVHAD